MKLAHVNNETDKSISPAAPQRHNVPDICVTHFLLFT